jgi:hypothetical protein
MKRKRHTPEQIIRKLRTAEQLLNQGQWPGTWPSEKMLRSPLISSATPVCGSGSARAGPSP